MDALILKLAMRGLGWFTPSGMLHHMDTIKLHRSSRRVEYNSAILVLRDASPAGQRHAERLIADRLSSLGDRGYLEQRSDGSHAFCP